MIQAQTWNFRNEYAAFAEQGNLAGTSSFLPPRPL